MLDIHLGDDIPAPADLTGLDALPNLKWLNIITTHPVTSRATIEALASCKLATLKRLAIHCSDLALEPSGLSFGAAALAGAQFPELEHLELSGNMFSSFGEAGNFARAPGLPRLRTLTLSARYDEDNPTFEQGHLEIILRACRGGPLEELEVTLNPAEGLGAFAGAFLPRLTSLKVLAHTSEGLMDSDEESYDELMAENGNGATDDVDEAMAALFTANLPALQHLDVCFINLRPYGGYLWGEPPENVNADVYPAIQTFELTKVCSEAAALLAATVAGRPSFPLRIRESDLEPALTDGCQMRTETAIRQRFGVEAHDVYAGAATVGWGEASLLGVLDTVQYNAASFFSRASLLEKDVKQARRVAASVRMQRGF